MASDVPAPVWRLLLVEDAAIDAELIADELSGAGMSFELRRVEDEAAYRVALDEQRPDVILADWTLPNFSGRAALTIARESRPELPFIFVAGTLPLGTARELLRHGAVDYVLKSQLVMLPLVLTRAIEEASQRADVSRRLQRTRAQLRLTQLSDELAEAEFMNAGLDLIEPLTGSRMAFVHFVDEDHEALELAAWSTQTQSQCATVAGSHGSISGAGIWADTLRTRQPTMINNYADFAQNKGLPAGHIPVERLLCVPITADGRKRAILGVGNKGADYDAFDVETLELLGGHLWRIAQRKRDELVLRATVAQLREANAQIQAGQEQLIQAAKMAAIGELAAGIAHELNTPLAYVKSNLGSLGEHIDSLLAIIAAHQEGADAPAVERREDFAFIKHDAPASIAEALAGIDKARRIVLDLKGFSRREEAQEWQVADLNRELDIAVNLVWNELKYKCTLHKRYGELPPVRCLPNRLGQVFVNLLVNAGQAIADKGEISLHTAYADGAVRIEVADTGAGIAPEIMARIFEPFYTTKPVGIGTGLGLALSADIVAQHGGRIEVDSEIGHGTSFRLWLPVAPPTVPPSEPTS